MNHVDHDDLDRFDPEEERLLQGARRGLTPSVADQDRVLALTQAAILAGGAGAAASTAGTAHAQTSLQLGALLPKLPVALVIAALSGSVGFQLGVRSEPRRATAETPQLTAAATTTPAPPPSAVPEAPPPSAAAPATPEPRAELSAAQASAREDAGTRSPRARARSAAASSTPDAGLPAPQLDPRTLQLEIDALARVEQALRRHDPKSALATLDALDRSVPDGKLAEERLAAFVMARCALGLGSAERLTGEFTRAFPRSVYRTRVEQSCKK